MEIEIKIEPQARKTKVVIVTPCITEEVQALMDRISKTSPKCLVGIKENAYEILEEESIIRIFAQNKKVFAHTNKGTYTLKLRLYEIETLLDKRKFIKISHAEIVCLNKIKSFDLSLSGTICVTLKDNTVTYASRRYVSAIKQILGI